MLGFFSYSLTMAITPGPNNIMAMQESRQRGFRGALPFLGGLLVSFFILDSFCFAFTHLLSALSPKALIGLRVIGSLYLAYLMVGLFRSAKTPPKDQPGQRRFWAAMLLNFMNVKVMLYFLIGYVSFLMPAFGTQMGIIFGFGILMALMTFAANLVWAAAGSVFQGVFNRYAIVVNVVLAVLFLYAIYRMWQ
ncbi:cysteine/O-acetylserine transporter [Secundilactobacillus similis DSM 23365 = JCM 2765]|uniref:Translocator protein, LysE family n=2 Tax=Secundilactobacillus similis TaxID=414682 RepID=A0A0R2FDN2_9LACO|nr:LysE family transporter [Secundilactobacillus similis]KRN26568.1 translocator protein, LysE family [Secundilactobacillus similis DSM 23365 = JCM 2765]